VTNHIATGDNRGGRMPSTAAPGDLEVMVNAAGIVLISAVG
jgi:hypothetical protein